MTIVFLFIILSLFTGCSAQSAGLTVTIEGTQYEEPLIYQYLNVFNTQSHVESNSAVQLVYFYQLGAIDDLPDNTVTRLEQNIVGIVTHDEPISSAQLASLIQSGGEILQLPYILTAVDVVYNLSTTAYINSTIGLNQNSGLGTPNGALNLTAPILSSIFQGKITTWNDPSILAINPNLSPEYNTPIKLVARGDDASTTNDLTRYFSVLDPTWGAATSTPERFAVNAIYAPDEPGMVQAMQATFGTIGYTHRRTARAAGLFAANLMNKAGNFVYPSQSALQAAELSMTADNLFPAFSGDWSTIASSQASGSLVYPCTAFIYFYVYANPLKIADTATNGMQSDIVAEFLQFVISNPALTTGYVPMSTAFYDKIRVNLDAIDQANKAQAALIINNNSNSYTSYKDSVIGLGVLCAIIIIILIVIGYGYYKLYNKVSKGDVHSKVSSHEITHRSSHMENHM